MRRSLTTLATLVAAAAGAFGAVAGTALADGPQATSATTATTPTSTTPTSTTPTTTTPPATTPTTTTPPAKPAPVSAHPRLYLSGAMTVSHTAVTVPGRAVKLRGYVSSYVRGQRVLVRAYVGRRQFEHGLYRIRRAPDGRHGEFTITLRSPAAGTVRVKIMHARTPQMLGFLVRSRYAVLDETASFGARGPLITLVQRRLAALHVYIPQTGVYDTQTGWALNAYHRLLGWGEGDDRIDARTVNALLAGRGVFHVRYPHDGKHVEGDLATQLIALAYGSRVYRIYPISSGKPSTPTVLGRFQVYSRVPGYLPDGMYYSSFFYRGYAVHGYDPAPDYPASHGCMRLPIVDAISVYDWLDYGDRVDVYR